MPMQVMATGKMFGGGENSFGGMQVILVLMYILMYSVFSVVNMERFWVSCFRKIHDTSSPTGSLKTQDCAQTSIS